jgi:hypothetical protein
VKSKRLRVRQQVWALRGERRQVPLVEARQRRELQRPVRVLARLRVAVVLLPLRGRQLSERAQVPLRSAAVAL